MFADNDNARIIKRLVVVGSLICAGSSASAQSANTYDSCDAVLMAGVFDVDSLQTNKSVYDAASDLMCLSESQRASSKDGWGLNLGVPIDGVPLQIGGSSTNNSASAWATSHCDDSRRRNSYGDVLSHVKRVASREILNAWSQCIANKSRAGLSCSISNIQTSGDHRSFVYKFEFRPLNLNERARITAIDTKNAVCDSKPKAGTFIDARDALTCTQTDPRLGVLISLHTSADFCSADIDPIPQKPMDRFCEDVRSMADDVRKGFPNNTWIHGTFNSGTTFVKFGRSCKAVVVPKHGVTATCNFDNGSLNADLDPLYQEKVAKLRECLPEATFVEGQRNFPVPGVGVTAENVLGGVNISLGKGKIPMDDQPPRLVLTIQQKPE